MNLHDRWPWWAEVAYWGGGVAILMFFVYLAVNVPFWLERRRDSKRRNALRAHLLHPDWCTCHPCMVQEIEDSLR